MLSYVFDKEAVDDVKKTLEEFNLDEQISGWEATPIYIHFNDGYSSVLFTINQNSGKVEADLDPMDDTNNLVDLSEVLERKLQARVKKSVKGGKKTMRNKRNNRKHTRKHK